MSVRHKLTERATKAERVLMAALDEAGEPYTFQFTIRTAEADAGRYYVDFYLPRRKLLVELDGSAHRSERRKWHDRLRTEAIKRARPNVTLVRFFNGDVISDPGAFVARLLSGTPSAQRRRRRDEGAGSR